MFTLIQQGIADCALVADEIASVHRNGCQRKF
jgi:hypothetical protein